MYSNILKTNFPFDLQTHDVRARKGLSSEDLYYPQ